ncbi:RNA-binding S4 domain-containing protein [Natranaerobius trueperi]|uniref:RNA-binding protein n=1 Tax=Natranaerobius trueperi TaxID=759412 RepID=A0A226BZB6_9FIRM|nr:RNA-binding S4 domain-containing protein [Natranaerobius trueperi]OWZ83470.1 RNA-binding protein [Natranaerobius trueperi]
MDSKNVSIETEYITLGQLLKYTNLVSTGGEVKHLIESNRILINGNETNKRGKKIYPGDEIIINNNLSVKVDKN